MLFGSHMRTQKHHKHGKKKKKKKQKQEQNFMCMSKTYTCPLGSAKDQSSLMYASKSNQMPDSEKETNKKMRFPCGSDHTVHSSCGHTFRCTYINSIIHLE